LAEAQKADIERRLDKVKIVAETKGQFGDFFGLLNGLMGCLTFIFIYKTFLLQGEAANSQLALQRETSANQIALQKSTSADQFLQLQREAYTSTVRDAINSYNLRLEAILVPHRDPETHQILSTWPGAHGLYHLWMHGMEGTLTLSGLDTGKDSENLSLRWQEIYEKFRYQLDALFRAWFHTLKTIETAPEYNIDFDLEWRTVARFRAQLSSIELTFLLANQVLSRSNDGNGYGEARRLCEKYAIFDNYELGAHEKVGQFLLDLAKTSQGHVGNHRLEKSSFSSELAKSLRADTGRGV
jgi:Putative phage abortive infection protein